MRVHEVEGSDQPEQGGEVVGSGPPDLSHADRVRG